LVKKELMLQNTFIGRKAQLHLLDDFLKKAASGQLQVAFISGEAGVGKSSLVEEFIRSRAEADPTLISALGECNAQTGSGDPYLPFRQVLTSLTTGTGEEKSANEISRSKRTTRLKEFVRISSQTLIKIGPDLIGIFVPVAGLLTHIAAEVAINSGLLPEQPGKKTGKERAKINPALDQEKIFEQYASVLKALSKDHTLILVLDDLQWADSGSLNLLFHLARQLKDSRILLLGTYRPDDVAMGREGARHPLESILNELKRYYGDIIIDLASSSPDEGRTFTNELIDSEPNHLGAAFREQLFAHTDGHPLFTVELLRNLKERGSLLKDKDGCWIQGSTLNWETLPARVEGVIGERIARLPEGLRETISIASVMGYDFIAQVVASVQKVPEGELVKDLARELQKRYLLVFEQGEIKIGKQFLSNYRFSHALTQQYLYDELSAGERRLWHGEIAETLEAISAEQSDLFALQLARHYDEAGNTEKAIPYWIMAGDGAFRAYAQNEAIAAYTRALELGKEIQISSEQLQHLYTRRGRSMELIGQFEQALENYAEMLATARARKDRRMELEAQVPASTLYSTPTAVMDPEKGQALSEESLKLAQELGDQSIECRVLWNLLLANIHGSRTDQAIDYGERSLRLARSLNLREQIPYTLTDLGRAYNGVCRFEEGEARLIEAAGLWRELGNMTMLNDNLNTLLLNIFWSGKYERALGVARESLEISNVTKNAWAQCWPHHIQGQIWFEYGEVDKALEELEASVRLAVEANSPIHTKWYGADLCWAYIQIGAIQKGMELYRTIRIPNEEIPAATAWTPTAVSFALCEIAAGQLDLAASTLGARRLSHTLMDYALKLAQCRLALARKDHAQAIAIIDLVVNNSQQFKVGQYISEALFLKGKAHWMNGEQDLAESTFEQARLAAEAIGSRHLLWQILSAMAEMEPDHEKSVALKTQTRDAIQFIADHISSDELQSLFLQSIAVKTLIA
jgi:tetratricopeptide (TPR) repeat protein/ABC-type transporter Mla MlaB component